MNHFGRYAMGTSKFSNGDTPVTGNLNNDIGDKSQIPQIPFAVEDPLFGSQFPLLRNLKSRKAAFSSRPCRVDSH
jgi:hypothetical protein